MGKKYNLRIKLIRLYFRWSSFYRFFLEKIPNIVLSTTYVWTKLFYPKQLKIIDEFSKKNNYFAGMNLKKKKSMIKDMLAWYYGYGFYTDEYMIFDFQHKTKEERLAFVSTNQMVEAVIAVTSGEAVEKFLFQDKWTLFQMFSTIYFREVVLLKKGREIDQECIRFVERHASFLIKPIDQYGGKGIEKINIEPGKEVEILGQLQHKAPLILEEIIQQSKEMSWLNPSSVNTVRIVTFFNDSDFEIAYSVLRIGRESAVVDNVTSGGIAMLIDSDSHRTGNVLYYDAKIAPDTLHPDSGKDLSDFEIPDWVELMSLLEQGIRLVPKGMHYAGWDFAHSTKGWQMVECNDFGAYDFRQTVTGKGEAEYFYNSINKYSGQTQ